MRNEYDLSKLRWKRNPYAKRLKRPVTIRLDQDLVEYFKKLGSDVGIPYQRLINMYLRECAESGRKAVVRWEEVT
jgi:predicted DNA binding CopG/RHH family protein